MVNADAVLVELHDVAIAALLNQVVVVFAPARCRLGEEADCAFLSGLVQDHIRGRDCALTAVHKDHDLCLENSQWPILGCSY